MDSNVTLALAKASSILLLLSIDFLSQLFTRTKSLGGGRMELELTGLSGADSLSSSRNNKAPTDMATDEASGGKLGCGSWGRDKWRAAIIFSTMATMRAWLNILSCSMTQAYNVGEQESG